jgi:hypothetical protein
VANPASVDWYSVYWCTGSLLILTGVDDDQGEHEGSWFSTASESPFQLAKDEGTADKGDRGPGVPKFENWSLKGSSTDPISELTRSESRM